MVIYNTGGIETGIIVRPAQLVSPIYQGIDAEAGDP